MKKLLTTILFLYGSVMAETRYLSSSGDDAADGLTPRTAWRTVGKLNATLRPGETARLRRGDVFYGGIKVPGGTDAAHPTVIADYGEGPKPVVTCTRTVRPDEHAWTAISPSYCIWRTNLFDPTNCTGTAGGKANVGFLLVDGRLMPQLRFCKDDVNLQWDFAATTDGWLYVHSTNNPARIAKDIRVALNEMGVRLMSNMVVSNIAIRATGGHGMVGGWDDVVTHVRISDCELENIGGSELVGYSREFRVRYGNGIEFGSNCSDAIVERCTVRGVYDTAFTMQGRPKTSWSDIHFRDCFVADSTQAFEVWCANASSGVGFERCSFVNNRTLNVGGGWGAEVRPNRQCVTPLLIYSMDTDTIDITVASNRFENVRYGLLYSSAAGGKVPVGYRVFDNVQFQERIMK